MSWRVLAFGQKNRQEICRSTYILSVAKMQRRDSSFRWYKLCVARTKCKWISDERVDFMDLWYRNSDVYIFTVSTHNVSAKHAGPSDCVVSRSEPRPTAAGCLPHVIAIIAAIIAADESIINRIHFHKSRLASAVRVPGVELSWRPKSGRKSRRRQLLRRRRRRRCINVAVLSRDFIAAAATVLHHLTSA